MQIDPAVELSVRFVKIHMASFVFMHPSPGIARVNNYALSPVLTASLFYTRGPLHYQVNRADLSRR